MATALAYRQPTGGLPAPIAPIASLPKVVHPEFRRPSATGLDPVAVKLEQLGKTVVVARGSTVVEEGDLSPYIYRVASGALRAVRLLPDGRRCVANFLLSGDFFGLTQETHAQQSIEALGDATLIRYPRAEFEALLDSDARAGKRFFSLICQELSAAQDRLLLLGRKSAVERLASFLLGIAKRCAANAARPVVDLPMSRVDIADYLGLTVETVSRVFSQFRSRKLIDLESVNQIAFLDQRSLEKISNGTAAV